MLSPVLPPSTQAAGVVAPYREASVPAGWPGVFVPNFSDWRVGDIVVAHHTPDLVGLGILSAQSASASPVTRAGRVYSHAAIYVGAGMVVDATLALGISEQSVWNYCQTRALQVRRIDDPTVPTADIADIAASARLHVGESYSWFQALVSKIWPGTVPIPGSLYCSTLVGLVVTEATGIDLGSDPAHQPLHPGTLAAHPELTDVLLEWRQL